VDKELNNISKKRSQKEEKKEKGTKSKGSYNSKTAKEVSLRLILTEVAAQVVDLQLFLKSLPRVQNNCFIFSSTLVHFFS
jgi:hypothetical protein